MKKSFAFSLLWHMLLLCALLAAGSYGALSELSRPVSVVVHIANLRLQEISPSLQKAAKKELPPARLGHKPPAWRPDNSVRPRSNPAKNNSLRGASLSSDPAVHRANALKKQQNSAKPALDNTVALPSSGVEPPSRNKASVLNRQSSVHRDTLENEHKIALKREAKGVVDAAKSTKPAQSPFDAPPKKQQDKTPTSKTSSEQDKGVAEAQQEEKLSHVLAATIASCVKQNFNMVALGENRAREGSAVAPLKITSHFFLDRNGVLTAPPQITIEGGLPYQREIAKKQAAYAISACSPFLFPKEAYNLWKEIEITFDPYKIFKGVP